jgi:hypothetical protein
MKAKANCGACGEAWFGDVAYCPYCGRRSATAPAPVAASHLPAQTDFHHGQEPEVVPFISAAADRSTHVPAGAEQARRDRKRWAKPLVLATVLAVLALAVGERAVTTRDKPAPQTATRAPVSDAARSGTVEMGAGVAASTPGVPRADVQPSSQRRATAPPARNRSLCSAANEAAGLCNPQ